MKIILLLSVVIASMLLVGCGEKPVADKPENKDAAMLKPGQPVRDVQVNINK